MNRTTLRQATGPVSFMLIVLVCWFVAGMVADRMVQQELDAAMRSQQQMSSSIVDNMAEVIASDLAMSRAIPATLAELGVIQHALARTQNYAVKRTDGEPPDGVVGHIGGRPGQGLSFTTDVTAYVICH